jgi:hypothetical protein
MEKFSSVSFDSTRTWLQDFTDDGSTLRDRAARAYKVVLDKFRLLSQTMADESGRLHTAVLSHTWLSEL